VWVESGAMLLMEGARASMYILLCCSGELQVKVGLCPCLPSSHQLQSTRLIGESIVKQRREERSDVNVNGTRRRPVAAWVPHDRLMSVYASRQAPIWKTYRNNHKSNRIIGDITRKLSVQCSERH